MGEYSPKKHPILWICGVLALALFVSPFGCAGYMIVDGTLEKQALERALEIYPDSALALETDYRVDYRYVVHAYYYVTDAPVSDVREFYRGASPSVKLIEGDALEWFETQESYTQIKSDGLMIINTHESECRQTTEEVCITVVAVEIEDGSTLILIRHWAH